ncbi:unnamed protein product [Orchesella dallaii]|uniref:Uncharacterized protein n=1 Tax=Orchesella dallaii TaxID=48710 RepID=A0ABP1R1M1_9HEXA
MEKATCSLCFSLQFGALEYDKAFLYTITKMYRQRDIVQNIHAELTLQQEMQKRKSSQMQLEKENAARMKFVAALLIQINALEKESVSLKQQISELELAGLENFGPTVVGRYLSAQQRFENYNTQLSGYRSNGHLNAASAIL